MKANVITFQNPTPKVYQRLPPPIAEIDEVLAFIFTGPCKPTTEDLKRTPLLVRRKKVGTALEWLKLNHIDYYDLDIDYDSLGAYPENGPPVVVAYRQSENSRNPEAISAFDCDDEDGVEDGPCPFVVHGITGTELETASPKTLIAKAIAHLKGNGKVLAIGHDEKPQSLYNNPQLYPMMFPHLFPYGLGGIGSVSKSVIKISDAKHKKLLLLYHDKRFQKDPFYPLVAFNQEQIKQCTTGGYLVTERHYFNDISQRLLHVNMDVLTDLSARLSKGERFKPETNEEKDCYQLISDLDHIAGNVEGSMSSKKYMRNEIWSLISYLGAPTWFITFAPADNRHPICLYYADDKTAFNPEIRTDKECYKLIAENPVAGARFFHFMVTLFIKHVLGVNTIHQGLFGNTSSYYGTVEQQGHLTLHLHMLLWVSCSLTPQEIKDKILGSDSIFCNSLATYLESLCVGQFLTGTLSEVSEKTKNAHQQAEYKDPTWTLPKPPANYDDNNKYSKKTFKNQKLWWKEFEEITDDLLLRSNIHKHKLNSEGKNISYCADKNGSCKRRFPREIIETTIIDTTHGSIDIKKTEPWMNTYTPLLTYLMRCNTDVTNLMSGTAIKAIVAYVTDYITKQSLKTYTVFDVIRTVIDRNTELLSSNTSQREKTRKIFIQIVNTLTAKLEVGSPMASLYLLENPDHYTSHYFVPFYWKGYVKRAMLAFDDANNSFMQIEMENISDKVVINKIQDNIVGLSKIDDYMH
jgi:hypothetical protein